jgi:hypothetical protein
MFLPGAAYARAANSGLDSQFPEAGKVGVNEASGEFAVRSRLRSQNSKRSNCRSCGSWQSRP